MKALKEKRVSLRSYFRRGLVILSLLALALAFAACNTSGGDEPTPTQPPETTPAETTPQETTPAETTPPRDTVIKIDIVTQPTGYSIQGAQYNLAGLTAVVTYQKPDGSITFETLKADSFSTNPQYADTPSASSASYSSGATWANVKSSVAVRDVGLVVKGYEGDIRNQDLEIPYVVPASYIKHVAAPTNSKWYADLPAQQDGLKYNVIVNDGWLWNINGTVGTQTLLVEPVTGSNNYPHLDLSKISDSKNPVSYYIGKNSSGSDATYTGTTNGPLKQTFELAAYYVPTGITVMNKGDFISAGNEVLDDYHAGKFYDTSGKIGKDQETSILGVLSKAGVTFKIFYNADGSNYRDLTVADFQKNNEFWIAQNPSAIAKVQFANGASGKGVVNGQGLTTIATEYDEIKVLNYDDDQNWDVILQYAPLVDIAGSQSIFPVTIPVCVFDDTISVKMKAGENDPTIMGSTGGAASMLTTQEISYINTRWELTARYTGNKTQIIAITGAMIYNGDAVASVNAWKGLTKNAASYAKQNSKIPASSVLISVSNGYGSGATKNGANNTWNALGGESHAGVLSGDLARNYVLPLFYRGVLLEDDETITTFVRSQN